MCAVPEHLWSTETKVRQTVAAECRTRVWNIWNHEMWRGWDREDRLADHASYLRFYADGRPVSRQCPAGAIQVPPASDPARRPRAAGLGGRGARITPASALRRKPVTYCRMKRRSADICLLHGKGVTEADSARGRRLPASSALCACYLFQQFGVAQHGAPLEARRRDCALGEGAAARFNVVDRVPPMH